MDFTACYEDTVSSVAAAARAGRAERVRALLGGGCRIDSRDNRGWTALHEAAAAGSRACVREILAAALHARSCRGAPDLVNAQTHEGESACYLAAQRGHLRVVRLLLKAHADIDQMTNDLSCPLYAAVDRGHKDVVELLVSKGAEVNRTHTASCWTCLHQAVYKGHSRIVSILVRVCNLEVLDDHGISPLFVAAQYGQTESLEALIHAGADVNSQAADLATPLLIAAQEGHAACVDLLLDHGADPNQACSTEWPQLPIHAAAEFGHTGILRRLLDVTDPSCGQTDGMVSPLYVAVNRGQTESVAMLLKAGYSPDAQDCTCSLGLHSPLTLALSRASSEALRECVDLLVAAGASLEEQDWTQVFVSDSSQLLQLVLQHRRFPQHESPSTTIQQDGRTTLKMQEQSSMLSAALSCTGSASLWLPVLLSSGLEPSVLLQPCLFEEADSEALNHLLEFMNWTTLPPPLRLILDQRRAASSWEPRPHFDSLPLLSHICRLRIREILGPDLLMRSSTVQQLPVPSLLHDFLQFRDIPETLPS
ncbi:ankyrin repeat and SOCS box protein 3 isoform X1 [Oryzias melastigma]|nr:ankyrin repeat and SOCS box protein 3 isoform X1 [Oryzias melastigma]